MADTLKQILQSRNIELDLDRLPTLQVSCRVLSYPDGPATKHVGEPKNIHHRPFCLLVYLKSRWWVYENYDTGVGNATCMRCAKCGIGVDLNNAEVQEVLNTYSKKREFNGWTKHVQINARKKISLKELLKTKYDNQRVPQESVNVKDQNVNAELDALLEQVAPTVTASDWENWGNTPDPF